MAYTYTPYQKKEYTQSDAVTQAQNALAQNAAAKPGAYQSGNQADIDRLYAQLQGRQPFKYDSAKDPLFRQIKDNYVQGGRVAMQDAMGQAAALTGGYGSSYGQQVGQQTYQQYLTGLNDRLMELSQMARQNYDADTAAMQQNYALAQNRENQDYSRYQDALAAWQNERNYLQGVADNAAANDYNRWANDQQFDYNAWLNGQNMAYQQDRDAVADQRYDQQWGYQLDRDAIADQRYDQQWDYQTGQDAQSLAKSQIDYLISIGAEIPESLIAASGYSPEFISAIKAVRASSGSGGGGSTSKSTTTNPTLTQIAKVVNSNTQTGNTALAKQQVDALAALGTISAKQAAVLKNNISNNAIGANIKSAPTEDELRRMHA